MPRFASSCRPYPPGYRASRNSGVLLYFWHLCGYPNTRDQLCRWLRKDAPDTPANLAEIERKLWDSADQLRANSGLRANEYSVPVLGLIFLRFADYKFSVADAELKDSLPPGSRRTLDKHDYQAHGVLYVPPEAYYAALLRLPEGADIAKAVIEAMRAIEAENPDLKDVLPKTYNRLDKDTLLALLKTFSEIQMDVEGDVFGKIYEYFLGEFARQEGTRGGEFFTPTAIVKLIVEILEPFAGRIVALSHVLPLAVRGTCDAVAAA
jgi:type I restriction enzyme M protein